MTDQTNANFTDDLFVGRQVIIHLKTGDTFQLIQGAAGMPQTATGNHGHRHARRGHHRRQNNGNLVAHAAGTVLIHLDAGNGRKIGHRAAVQHGLGQGVFFRAVQAAYECGHQPGRHLVIGQGAFRVTVD